MHYATSSTEVEKIAKNLRIVKILVQDGNANINAQDVNGVTPLMNASHKDQLAIFSYLISRKNIGNFNVRDNGGKALIHHLAVNRNYAAIWRLRGSRDNTIEFQKGKYGIKFNLQDNEGNTALHIACKNFTVDFDSVETIRAFTGFRYSLGNRNKQGLSESDMLARVEGVNEVEILRAMPHFYGASGLALRLTPRLENYFSSIVPIFSAVQNDFVSLIQYFRTKWQLSYEDYKDNRDLIVVKDSNNKSLLHLASEYGSIKVIKYLIENTDPAINGEMPV